MNDNEKDNKKKLHGNLAKITDNVVPRFTAYVPNNNGIRNDIILNRLEDDADFCKKEVDANQK